MTPCIMRSIVAMLVSIGATCGAAETDSARTLVSGEFRLTFQQVADGLQLTGMTDTAINRELLSASRVPLFTLTLRAAADQPEFKINSDSGWGVIEWNASAADGATVMRWARPAEGRAGDLSVEVAANPHAAQQAVHWTIRVKNEGPCCVRRVAFPQVSIADLGPDGEVLFPRGSGEVQTGLWQRDFGYSGLYPGGWTSMQFLAAYQRASNTGLYLAVHDPLASTKDIAVESRAKDRAVLLRMEHPAPAMNQPGNDFELSGTAVTQLLRGDWFDASVIYRDWVRKEARWYPKLGKDGRDDTPMWMRELCAWAMTGGTPQDCADSVAKMAEYFGMPVGFHWYNWHQIPFDNDYPHYFPVRDGFADGVKKLQASHVHVMPYINGRLWDTHDKGSEDLEFSKIALPGVTKQEDGQPFIESYGSKESDGQPVRLGVMCPTTEVWRKKVDEIVGRLFGEYGLDAVYIDQIAAASPTLCSDASHGHPAGGGHWWTEGYWQLLDDIRRKMPADRMLTTECNGEPFIRCFDGYLTWHWQFDGQVPAFPAVYGGAIQMFGRAYRGGATKDLALRMKAGQQLVFGEQLGWLEPGIVNEPANAAFFREAVRLRWQLRPYFFRGEMARPPRLETEIPNVKADWQWSGEWPVQTPAVMTGAWRIPSEGKVVLIFANVSDNPVASKLDFDSLRYGLEAKPHKRTVITQDGPGESGTIEPACKLDVNCPPRKVFAWEISSASP